MKTDSDSPKEFKYLKPYHGIILFILVILSMIFIAAPMQMEWGMWGLALTELMILLLAVIPAILLKTNLKEVFPIKKPKLSQMAGVVVLWVGSYLAVILVTLIIGYFFPKGLFEVSNSIQDVFTSIPMGIAFIIIAVTPAICEEALVRGFIMYSFYPLKKKWLIVFFIGIIFGIFHLDPYRFFPTAILGAMLAYIMIETKNILLPALFHFINNGLTTITSFLSDAQMETPVTALEIPLISIGAYFIIGAAIPFIFYGGAKLLHKNEAGSYQMSDSDGKKKRNMIWLTVGCSVSMFVIGVVIIFKSGVDFMESIYPSEPVFQTHITGDVNYDSGIMEIPLDIEKAGNYIMDFEIRNKRSLIDLRIVDDSGNSLYQTTCMEMTCSGQKLALNGGTYKILLDFNINDLEEYCRQMGLKYDDELKEDINMTGDLYEYMPYELSIKIR